MSAEHLKTALSSRVIPALAIQGGGNRVNMGYAEFDTNTQGLVTDVYGRPVNASNTLKIADQNSSAALSQPYNAARLMAIELEKRPILTSLDQGLSSYDTMAVGRNSMVTHLYGDSYPNAQFFHHQHDYTSAGSSACGCCASTSVGSDHTPQYDPRLSQVPMDYARPNIF